MLLLREVTGWHGTSRRSSATTCSRGHSTDRTPSRTPSHALGRKWHCALGSLVFGLPSPPPSSPFFKQTCREDSEEFLTLPAALEIKGVRAERSHRYSFPSLSETCPASEDISSLIRNPAFPCLSGWSFLSLWVHYLKSTGQAAAWERPSECASFLGQKNVSAESR